MINGYIIVTLISIDIADIVEVGQRAVKVYEGVCYWEKFKISHFKKIIEKLFIWY